MTAFGQRWRGEGWRRAGYVATAAGLLAAGMLACAGSDDATADVVLLNGTLATVDAASPRAAALAARDGRIVFVGSSQEAESWIGSATEVIDLEGGFAMPGWIEGHGHFFGLGQTKLQLALGDAETWQEIVDMVAAAAQQSSPGVAIVGRGWHQSKWRELPSPAVEGLPVHDSLSTVSPDNPVVLGHASGHASFVNARALEMAGVGPDTPDPSGGEIVRGADGRATGMLRETAQGLVANDQEWDWNHARRVVGLAADECLAKGITSFQDAGSSFQLIDFYRELAADGALPVRLWVMARATNEELAAQLGRVASAGVGDHHFTLGGIKKSIDGALGSHGAWLLAPYQDLPESSGLNTTPIATIEEAATLALEHDLQLCIHAIGDRANRETLDLFERAFDAAGVAGKDRRWRIEHAQHLHPDDVDRFAELGVVASMQAVHCTSDGPWVPDRLGDERSEDGAYLWRSLLDLGVVVSNGTDAPVEDVSPLATFHAAVSRRMNNGERFYPEQRMTREEALRSGTLAAAYAAFEEDLKGSLEVGKLADVVVLSKNILDVAEEEILDAEVLYTLVGGEVRYRADER